VARRAWSLDTRTEAGRKALRKLAEAGRRGDPELSPGVADRMGVGYASLAAAKPSLVYVSISGYGATGPMAGLPALDTTVQALSGLMHSNRDESGQPRKIGSWWWTWPPRSTCAASDGGAYRAARTGRGRHVEVPCSSLRRAAIIHPAGRCDVPRQRVGGLGAPWGFSRRPTIDVT